MQEPQSSAQREERSRRVGGTVGMVIAILTGAALGLLAERNLALIASIAGATVVVTAWARRIGRLAGQRIARHSIPAALGIGALCGLSSLLVAALCAGASGLIWSLFDHIRAPGWLYSYIGKPFLAVLFYGGAVALALGVVGGLAIRLLVGRRR